ncbi:MAG TPA: L,D-transpeptidase [Solirubrobacteraceae bacterium]|jgi:peptidoglycan hydrolase-like protein with peptidoglycan-binding domain|nr:L,D-transpeptidase [Solirubrobacteraceae bacterium]
MQRIARGVFVLLLLAMVLPWSASAAATPTTPTTPPPVAPPAAGTLRLAVAGVFRVSHKNVTVSGRSMTVTGVAKPFVAGQVVAVKIRNGRHLVKSGRFRLKQSRNGTYGSFTVHFSSRPAGQLSISAVHSATPQLVHMAAVPQKVDVIVPAAGPGSTGTFVSLIQSRLSALHFAVPQDGVYDQLTQNAVLAYRKLRGFARIYTLDGGVIAGLLDGVGSFHVRFPGQGSHVEANLTSQTLALINGSKVFQIYPTSSGKPSTPTVLGTYHVYRRTPGYLPDGMYFSSFFTGGYAIHGYNPAPVYPASHGCLRLPIDDAIAVYGWVKMGMAVDVYYGAN